ncbi:MAG TPA: hypothetical protein PKD20_03145 [Candidatus Saccharibacteria bacterium]|jgi:hypothetical protein|nr:hypothetical protein [Candidatus Saccharibacteria bacterium]HMT55847.1 hypothetical protein [Candidatus Saccharibacteria bacterium]
MRFILDRGEAFTVAFLEAHRHNNKPEVYFTCILGSWDDENDQNDHVTFACRYGEVVGQSELACTLTDVPNSFVNSLSGQKLTRTEGLKHEKINEFWHVVDYLLESDSDLHIFLNHPFKSRLRSLLHY